MPKHIAALFLALALGACSGSSPEPPAQPVPAPTTTSVVALAHSSDADVSTITGEAPVTPEVASPAPEAPDTPAPANSVVNGGPLLVMEESAPVIEPEPYEGDVGAVASESDGSLDWAALRQCESGGDYGADTGNGYGGAYQFDGATWAGVGGTGDPSDASEAEQDMRAGMLYDARGAAPWPTCGALLWP